MEIEIRLLQWLQDIRTPFLDAIMQSITWMGEGAFIIALVAILYWCGNKKLGKYMMWTVLFSSVLNGMIKDIVKRPRPYMVGVVKPVGIPNNISYAFPSCHAQVATSFWASAINQFKNKAFVIVGSIVILLVSMSRLYLGVHWTTDVLAGVFIGILSIMLSDRLLDTQKGIKQQYVIIMVIVALVASILPLAYYTVIAIGALTGFIVGAYIEERYIQFDEHGDLKKQLIKLIIGIGGSAGYYYILKQILSVLSYNLIYIIGYAGLMFWVMAGAPYFYDRYLGQVKSK